MAFKLFILKGTDGDDQIVSYPEHYANHPVFGKRLEPYDPDLGEWEEDKVVSDNHELPLEQRITMTAKPVNDDESDADADDDEEND